MTPLRIAAVIPAFNAAASVAAAIASAQGQTRPPDEILVVDDGSADDTAGIAEHAGARVLRQPNRGPGAARNAGINATDADWIALLDADDMWRPDRIAHQVSLTADEGIGVIYGGHAVPGKDPGLPPAAMDFESLWQKNRVPTSSVLLRRVAWQGAGGFDERRELIGVEDYNLWLRMAFNGWRFVGIQERLVDYQPTHASLTSQTERFAVAELAQLAAVAKQLELHLEKVRQKEFAIHLHYGQELFYYRQLRAARAFLRGAARRGPLPMKARVQLLASFLPLPRRSTD